MPRKKKNDQPLYEVTVELINFNRPRLSEVIGEENYFVKYHEHHAQATIIFANEKIAIYAKLHGLQGKNWKQCRLGTYWGDRLVFWELQAGGRFVRGAGFYVELTGYQAAVHYKNARERIGA